MKKILMTESQMKYIIKEFIQPGFSLKYLDSLTKFQDKFLYCDKYLGETIGEGMSRATFDYNDELVLKLAKGLYHTRQNKSEYANYMALKNKMPNIIPRVYKAADDFSWIICERVMELSNEDCIALLGMPYYSDLESAKKEYNDFKQNYSEYNKSVDNIPFNPMFGSRYNICLEDFVQWAQAYSQNYSFDSEANRTFKNLMKNNEILQELYSYISIVQGMNDIHFKNLGIAMRNNKPTIVVLDSGFDKIEAPE